ncbi:SHOCT domain-containing protein [Halorubrum tibetense]|uniref:SHOCT domain-containing protein n=1 Tax=Halorubrum tibetense TaxID=175631 RepID=A0ABD5SH24_9EURY
MESSSSRSPSPRERARRNATGIVSTVVTGTWLAALFLGFDWWLALLLFGYIVVVPVTAMLFGDEDDWEEWVDEGTYEDVVGETDTTEGDVGGSRTADTNNADALQRLRTRYANGELTDDQFERKLDRLLETETPESAEEWRRREQERDVERER